MGQAPCVCTVPVPLSAPLSILPLIEKLPYWIVGGLDSCIDGAGLVPLCAATLIVYLYTLSRR